MLTILLGRARSWSIAHPGTLSKPGHVAVWLTSHVKFSWRSWQSEDGGISIHTNVRVFTGRSGWIVVLANGTCHDLVDSLGSSWIVVASTLQRSRGRFKRFFNQKWEFILTLLTAPFESFAIPPAWSQESKTTATWWIFVFASCEPLLSRDLMPSKWRIKPRIKKKTLPWILVG